MSNPVKAIPGGYESLIPNLVTTNAAAAIEFYKTVFGATDIKQMTGPGGKVMHAEMKIGNSLVFINDTMNPEGLRAPAPGTSNPMYLHIYVEDVDAIFSRALAAGSRVEIPLQDMFWGDRYGKLTDPFGQQWGIATRKENVTPEEMTRRMQSISANAAGQS